MGSNTTYTSHVGISLPISYESEAQDVADMLGISRAEVLRDLIVLGLQELEKHDRRTGE